MMKSIVIGSLLVLAMGSQVSFAVSGAHIYTDGDTVSLSPAPAKDLSPKPLAKPDPVDGFQTLGKPDPAAGDSGRLAPPR